MWTDPLVLIEQHSVSCFDGVIFSTTMRTRAHLEPLKHLVQPRRRLHPQQQFQNLQIKTMVEGGGGHKNEWQRPPSASARAHLDASGTTRTK